MEIVWYIKSLIFKFQNFYLLMISQCDAVTAFTHGEIDDSKHLRNALVDYFNEQSVKLRSFWLADFKISMDKESQDKEWIQILRPKKNQYLESIHVFALANLLKRTIIVLGTPLIGEIEINSMVGIYPPILAKECCSKLPIVLIYIRSHFSPLLLVIEEKKQFNLEYLLPISHRNGKVSKFIDLPIRFANKFLILQEYLNVHKKPEREIKYCVYKAADGFNASKNFKNSLLYKHFEKTYNGNFLI